MTYGKFKSLIALLLVSVFIVTSSFSNIAFANVSTDGQETIMEGVYYIRNSETELYMNDLDGYTVSLSSKNSTNQQKWELIYVSDGYYYIKNINNGKYLTAPVNSNEGSYIEQDVLSPSKSSRQLWFIETMYSGSEMYYIQSQNQENANLYASSSKTMGIYGYNLIQSSPEDYLYYNFWFFEKVQSATLIGINFTSSSTENHTSAIIYSNDEFISNNWQTNMLIPSSMTSSAVTEYLENSNAFILYTHGGWDSSGTYAYLTENGNSTLHTTDIYNYVTGTHLDMSNCDIAIFAGCYTAYNSTYNLPLASVHSGANCGVGFADGVYCGALSTWIEKFSIFYNSGISTELAIEYTNNQTSFYIDSETVIIYAQGG